MSAYIAVVHKDARSDYGVSFPDFPGCFTAGHDLNEARAFAGEALALHIEGMAADGLPIPEPSSLDAVMSDPVNRDGVAILVEATTQPTRAVRINITLPEATLREIDAHAEARGYTRSGFLAAAARRALREEAA